MSLRPPPLPESVRASQTSAFADQAANACLAAPLLILAFTFFVSLLTNNHHDSSTRSIFMIFGLLAVGVLGLGILAGILAVVMARASQRTSVIARVAGGWLIVALLMAIAVPNFVRARALALQNKQTLVQLRKATAEMRAQAVASLTNGDSTIVDERQLQRTLTAAAKNSSGETAAILKATQRHVARTQMYMRDYEQASRRLIEAKVLATKTLEQRAQIQDRKTLVQNFIEANEAFKAFLVDSESNFRQELVAGGVSPEQTEAALGGFRKNLKLELPLLLAIREADLRMGRGMLSTLKLYDDQWDRWRYDPASNQVRFEDSTTLSQYKALMTQIKEAGVDQEIAQQRLAVVIAQASQSSATRNLQARSNGSQ